MRLQFFKLAPRSGDGVDRASQHRPRESHYKAFTRQGYFKPNNAFRPNALFNHAKCLNGSPLFCSLSLASLGLGRGTAHAGRAGGAHHLAGIGLSRSPRFAHNGATGGLTPEADRLHYGAKSIQFMLARHLPCLAHAQRCGSCGFDRQTPNAG